ncbi:MAG: glycoside hydrolase family 2 TIM barrel-domain containing protein [Mucilaginibacter sp.]
MKRLLCFALLVFQMSVQAQPTQYQYLSGTDRDNAIDWDFYINTGMQSGKWSKIKVPSNWEQQGFGTYNYYTDTNNPNETGLYKYKFKSPADIAKKKVFIVFDGSMTDTEVKINGKLAGPVHQGGFCSFKYDITKLLKSSGLNLLDVSVRKKSANKSVNRAEREADFWQFGGIFRPVFLEIVPITHIDRVAIDTKADGTLTVDAYTTNTNTPQMVVAELQTIAGVKIGSFETPVIAGGLTKISKQFKDIATWNPEDPNLYIVKVSITQAGKMIHTIQQKTGFRTAELRPGDGFYVNDVKVIFKGVNRHSFSAESARALSKQVSIDDVKLMKGMNMNAVRMSHYPPDRHFLDVCDSLGMFVINELTGWQKSYDTIIGRKLVKELVIRDVNHPSIVMWANGNEGGFNRAIDNDYDLYDNQKRVVIHPWERFRGTDTRHYPDYNYVTNALLYGTDVFFPTEFMHGNFDGGMGAGLQDFWDAILQHPLGAGGFLWSFADEGIMRTDRNGEIDNAGNSAPDGIVGAHHEKEGSFQSVRKIWSPVVVTNKVIPVKFNGKLSVENRYLYTDLSSCKFIWKLLSYPKPGSKSEAITNYSSAAGSNLIPGEKGYLQLDLPANWQQSDGLSLTVFDKYGLEIYTWSWPLQQPKSISVRNIEATTNTTITVTENETELIVNNNKVEVYFSKTSGLLKQVISSGKKLSLSNGPVLAQARADMKLQYFKFYKQAGNVIVKSAYKGLEWLNVTWTFAPGLPAKLDYEYGENNFDQQIGYNFTGITFNYPETMVTGMQWLGNGPDRVYKNRLAGAEFGIWHKDYNDGITGENYIYPEFKGYHGEVFWVRVENKEIPFTVYTENKGIYLQMLKPGNSKHSRETTVVPMPAGDIGFMNGIPPIGTKFQRPDLLGPASQQNIQLNYSPVNATLWFDFR